MRHRWTLCEHGHVVQMHFFLNVCSSMSMYNPFSGVLEGVCGERYSEYKTDTRYSATENIF